MDKKNLRAAMDKVVESISMTVAPIANKEDDGPAGAQVLIRTTIEEKERWRSAAEKEGITLSQMFRETMNKKATDILDCTHPLESRLTYPWSEFCKKCDVRLR